MKVYRPIRTNNKTQVFGANLACAKTNVFGGLDIPTSVVTRANELTVCPLGYKPFYPLIGMKGHNGEDWQSYNGEPIFFPVHVEGVEWQAATEVDRDGGIGVRIRSKTPVPLDMLPPQARGSLNMIEKQWEAQGHAVYLIFLFWHLKAVDVYDKKPIAFGDRIGWADSTGASSGPHVHFAMKVSDVNSWFTIDSDNGYTGAIDFSHWFSNQFVLDVISAEKAKNLPGDQHLGVIAEQYQKEGNNKLAAQLWAILDVLRAFLK